MAKWLAGKSTEDLEALSMAAQAELGSRSAKKAPTHPRTRKIIDLLREGRKPGEVAELAKVSKQRVYKVRADYLSRE